MATSAVPTFAMMRVALVAQGLQRHWATRMLKRQQGCTMAPEPTGASGHPSADGWLKGQAHHKSHLRSPLMPLP